MLMGTTHEGGGRNMRHSLHYQSVKLNM